MNTLTHKLAAALLLLCGFLADATAINKPELPPASAAAGDMAGTVVSSASSLTSSVTSSINNNSANSSTSAASAITASTPASASASTATSAAAIGKVGNHVGMTPASSAPASGVGGVLQVISALILVVIIMLGLAWGLKNFGPKRLLGRVPVQVVGGANLGGRERVLVIEVADQWIVIGATPSSITTLATLPRQALNDDELQPGKPFSDWLKQIMEKRNG